MTAQVDTMAMAAKNTKTLIVTAFVFNGDEVSMKPARKLAISVETVYINYPLVIVVILIIISNH